MTPAAEAVRSVLGPLTSETKCREVVKAVLEAIREPSDGATDAGNQARTPAHPIAANTTSTWKAVVDFMIEEEWS